MKKTKTKSWYIPNPGTATVVVAFYKAFGPHIIQMFGQINLKKKIQNASPMDIFFMIYFVTLVWIFTSSRNIALSFLHFPAFKKGHFKRRHCVCSFKMPHSLHLSQFYLFLFLFTLHSTSRIIALLLTKLEYFYILFTFICWEICLYF